MAAAARRSGNYKPSLWDNEYLQSITSVYGEKTHLERAEMLKEEVVVVLKKISKPIDQIEVIDVLQRLGIFYHFTDYIDKALENINNIMDNEWHKDDLHATALKFRLLRRHGYFVPQEVLINFTDKEGNFKNDFCDDTEGILSLYEASYLSLEGESIMDAAQVFATDHLKKTLKQLENDNQSDLAELIAHSLELPLHWRMLRFEAKWFIDMYERRHDDKIPILLEFAKLDFNIVQAMYQDELKQLSRWYVYTQFAEKMKFARNRLVESFLWTIGFTFEPRFRYCRIMSVKLAILITVIDDIYDVYGTLDELELFTRTVERWDINELEHLPEYMRLCFLALFNWMNDQAYDVLKSQGFNAIPYLKTMWAELSKAYLLEARWCSVGYTPSLKEYLENALVSITGPLILGHTYFCITDPIRKKTLEDLVQLPALIRWASIIARITDDLGTSSDEIKKGDGTKSIQCHMHEMGCSEADARDYIKHLVGATWKKINKEASTNQVYSKDFVEAVTNYVRVHQFMYQHGDGHGDPLESGDRIMSMVVKPIAIEFPEDHDV